VSPVGLKGTARLHPKFITSVKDMAWGNVRLMRRLSRFVHNIIATAKADILGFIVIRRISRNVTDPKSNSWSQ
jgi:hypothetical protein